MTAGARAVTLLDVSHPFPQVSNVSPVRKAAWIVAAVLAWTVNPIALVITVVPSGLGRDCSSPTDVPPGCPQAGLTVLAAMMMLAAWLLFTGLIGLVFGVIEGCHLRFVKGHVVPAVLVAVAMPWAMAAFALGAGVGRLAATFIDRPRQTTG
jgi:hypothetical protein